MRQLVYKDLFFFRVIWLVNLVMPLLFFMLDASGELLFPMSCLFITFSSVMTLTVMDERNKSDIVINSLPVSRKDIIIARYISCAIFIVGAILSTMLVVFLIRGIVVISDIGVYHPNLYIEIPWYEVINGAVYAAFFVVTFFPSYYGTKSKVVRSIGSAASIGVGVILWIFISDGLNETTSSFSEWIMNPVHIGVFIVGGMILASVYIASMFLTIKIYETRDL
ncbi:ABC-2 transporter permease [Bacillus cereus group sp. MYBK163-2]|jgi:ABC-2 type transport system permease protein|uniref:ABC-2 transporter permease n=1 Tax=Bacillus cereus TaxID=1396 RepID=A0A9X7CFD9_BACCE|nr:MULTISPECIES: ABC-2 transporter permease [Bacillus cereus group]MDA2255755.1 ABC-2 transporter permease [Bacillus cereus]MDA2503834.1 ABC-2 transporter permease [Bacillus cereus]MEC1982532.1 ABC-2 transporter permease [Bacillus cereus]OPA42920.1 ABC transporter permease [Bacillus cereus]PGO80970.1 ABC-2 transporter permease [Bacillus cereus]